MIKFNLSLRSVMVVGILLTAAGLAYLLRADLARVSAFGPPPAPLAGPTCNVISGFVYFDADNNGLKDVGEMGILGSTLELRNSSNVVVGMATTDASGYYQFTVDNTISTLPQTITYTATFPESDTDQTRTMNIPKFNPDLGMLTSVKINSAATFKSTAGVENTSTNSGATITVTVNNSLSVTVPGISPLINNASQSPVGSPFMAAVFDGVIDFGGPAGTASGTTFPQIMNSANAMTTTSDQSVLAQYTGTGDVTISAIATATTVASGGGSIVTKIDSTASAVVTVTYTYMPSNCLAAGNYKIVQTAQPAGYADGYETAGNVTPIPGSNTTDFINVTLAGANLLNNNFGEVLAADLAIIKTDNQTTTTPGSPLTYQIVVTNNGPSAVTNATVTDTMPVALTSVTWTCAASSGGSCGAANGAGNINTTVSLPVGGTATFTVHATVSASASGTITNTATVTAPPGVPDNNQGNNTATDQTDVNVVTDLAVTKTDGLTTTTLNSLIQYTIVVTNNGPATVTNAPVTDTMPSNLSNVGWTCTATPGSSCGANFGLGDINMTVSLAVNGKATFIVDARVTSENPSLITNTVTVAVPQGVTDTNPGNNTATDITAVQVGGCPIAGAPTTVRGFQTSQAFPQGDLFLLPTDLQFTLIAPAAGGANFFPVNDATTGGNPGFAGVTSLGLSASAPNSTTRMLSCLDSFREIGFVLAAKGVTDGDAVSLLVQNPDGSGQATVAAFVFESGQFKVTQINAGVALFVNGNVPAGVGTLLPLSATLGDSLRTLPITALVGQPGPLAGCFELAVDVARAGGAGTTSVVLTNVNVVRNTVAGDAARPETGLLGGLSGGYPTGAVCGAVCPTVCVPPLPCNERICFHPPDYYCSRGIPLVVKTVRIPQINFGYPVAVRVGGAVSPVVLRYLGCGIYAFEAQASTGRMLTRYYLAAQISIASDPQHPNPSNLQLGCFLMMMGGMPSPLPLSLSNGYTITATTSLQDLFKQTESAIIEGRAADAALLLKIYKMLGCGD